MKKKVFKYILFLVPIFLFTACSVKEPKKQFIIKKDDIHNLVLQSKSDSLNQEKAKKEFFDNYFKPWDMDKLSYSKREASWGHYYKYKKIYLENHKLASKSWFEKQIDNSNFDEYNTLLKKAITLKNSNLRVLPTNSPMFYNPKKAGEGFPFDYNQNSLLKINTPLLVSHYSKDRAWVYVQSYSVGGWIKIDNIAFVDEVFINEFKSNDYYVAIKEKFPIYTPIFREYVKLGTIFPKKNDKYLIAKALDNQNAQIKYIYINDFEIEKMPLTFTKKNITKIAKQLEDEPYGWGGLLNNRDCSSFTQDFFVPFGKYLDRNSKAQTKNGKYFDISSLSNKEKKEYIKKHAIAFSTLIYLKGHIMLYVGIKKDEPLAMHNMWSVRLKNSQKGKYRHIVGKTSITTLEPGNYLKDFDESNNILKKIRGIIIL